MDALEHTRLKTLANRLRREAVAMVYRAGAGHAAPALSVADILVTLYFHEMRLDPSQPLWPERDVFILSKGHACPIYYATLAERGFFPWEWLQSYRDLDTRLPGHPVRNRVPGVDMTTGSLGNGLSLGVGKALAARRHGRDSVVYVLLGDGEIQEGLVWEAAMFAGSNRLGRLVAIIDNNGLQSGGATASILNLDPLEEKWKAFGWHVQRLSGHDIPALAAAIRRARDVIDQPSLIIADTVKGKGVSFMEGNYLWHMKAPSDEEYRQALRELAAEGEDHG